MKAKKIYLIGFSLIFLAMIAQETRAIHQPLCPPKSLLNKLLSGVGDSRPVSFLENICAAPVYAFFISKILNDKEASAEYKNMGKEAQVTLGISSTYQIPIRTSSSILKNEAAVTFPHVIYINEPRLALAQYGAKRATLFHEMVHKKYNDRTCLWVANCAAFLAGGFLAKKLCLIKTERSVLVQYPLIIAGAFGGLYLISRICSYFAERRADIEAHWAVDCHRCVCESADRRHVVFEDEGSPLKHKGYLSCLELERIAEFLKQRGRVCSHHQE